MDQVAFSKLLSDPAQIECLIREAEGRASDAAAAIDDEVVKRTILEPAQLSSALSGLRLKLADRVAR